VVAFTDLPHPRERLGGMLAALDACQRALSDFLEEKRGAFPRWGTGGVTISSGSGLGLGHSGLVWFGWV